MENPGADEIEGLSHGWHYGRIAMIRIYSEQAERNIATVSTKTNSPRRVKRNRMDFGGFFAKSTTTPKATPSIEYQNKCEALCCHRHMSE